MPFKPTDYLPYDFANRRHIGPSPEEMGEMLEVLGAESLEGLIDETVPKSIRQDEALDFGKPLSERELMHKMRMTAGKNKGLTSLIGQGSDLAHWAGVLRHGDAARHSAQYP